MAANPNMVFDNFLNMCSSHGGCVNPCWRFWMFLIVFNTMEWYCSVWCGMPWWGMGASTKSLTRVQDPPLLNPGLWFCRGFPQGLPHVTHVLHFVRVPYQRATGAGENLWSKKVWEIKKMGKNKKNIKHIEKTKNKWSIGARESRGSKRYVNNIANWSWMYPVCCCWFFGGKCRAYI